jgi:hypothetical protein
MGKNDDLKNINFELFINKKRVRFLKPDSFLYA